MKNINYIKHFRLLILTTYCLFAILTNVKAQQKQFSNLSIKTATGFGYNQGKREEASGLVYSIGLQKTYGVQNKFRLNPNLMIGGFSTSLMNHSDDQFYRITNLNLNAAYDVIRVKPVSLFLSGGGFVNYSRGLIGNGGKLTAVNKQSDYFYTLYYGLNALLGFRIDDENKIMAYEIKPISLFVGNKNFFMAYLMFGIDFKLRKQNK